MVRKMSQMLASNQMSFKMLGVIESEVFENRTNVIQMVDSRSQIPRPIQVAQAWPGTGQVGHLQSKTASMSLVLHVHRWVKMGLH